MTFRLERSLLFENQNDKKIQSLNLENLKLFQKLNFLKIHRKLSKLQSSFYFSNSGYIIHILLKYFIIIYIYLKIF